MKVSPHIEKAIRYAVYAERLRVRDGNLSQELHFRRRSAEELSRACPPREAA